LPRKKLQENEEFKDMKIQSVILDEHQKLKVLLDSYLKHKKENEINIKKNFKNYVLFG